MIKSGNLDSFLYSIIKISSQYYLFLWQQNIGLCTTIFTSCELILLNLILHEEQLKDTQLQQTCPTLLFCLLYALL